MAGAQNTKTHLPYQASKHFNHLPDQLGRQIMSEENGPAIKLTRIAACKGAIGREVGPMP